MNKESDDNGKKEVSALTDKEIALYLIGEYDKAIKSVQNNPFYLSNLIDIFRDDKDIVLEAVKRHSSCSTAGYALEYASKKLQNDKNIVIAAIKSNSEALRFASKELRNDKEVVLMALSSYRYECVLQYVSEELRDDKDVVLEAVKFGGYELQYASMRLRNDRDIVLMAVGKNGSGSALKYASKLRDDYEIVLTAVNQNGLALEYASPRLRSNREVVIKAVKNDGGSLMYASPCFYDDKEVFITAFGSSWMEDGADSGTFWRRDAIESCMSRRLREDPSISDYAFENHYNGGSNLFLQLIEWKYVRELKKEWEERWQEKYGQINKDRLLKWQNDILQWQQNQKKYQFKDYKLLRKQIEEMPMYKNWQKEVFKKYGKTCQVCGEKEDLEIHHRQSMYSIVKINNIDNIYKAIDCKNLWNVENGIVLCIKCHEKMESSQAYKELSTN